jgi:hypothetical protein
MVKCSFKKKPSDANSPLEEGYFHGFYQEGVTNTQGQIFAIIHSAEDTEGTPFRFYPWQTGLFFNKHKSE